MTKTASKYQKELIRTNRELRKVKLSRMKVSSHCQRELRTSWVDELVSNFDLEKLGNPEVSERDGYFYVMDGQHRVAAVKKWLGEGWEDQHIECWVATGLTEEQEAEVFLSLNKRLNIDSFEKFKVGVMANRPDETAVSDIVKAEKLVISKINQAGAVRAVTTLLEVYRRNGADALQRALRLARDSYGDPGLDANVIGGFGLLCHRYNGSLNDNGAVESLSRAHGGVNGLLNIAEQMRQKTGNPKKHCVAAASVVIINRDRKGKDKLPDWFKDAK